ncbi:hypothetical protein [Mastigocoleus testarum]|uniref:Uncharacterized protein n=1 Tax=Mastigocoleus testarum BC008 TaxID=371196 RepID=A0A0V7ZVJ0_9CYAN|nr:hypothetical protein [Mastigocoleus testarum]KST68016.1 hypothetical protein BC008_32045 [Mastigocoleus testarum BC008]KST68359.1 hypothetical protein BC008_33080 [Mastigocoleus testarum BC008]
MSTIKEKIEFPDLPLAVYREVAAHLRQVDGVKIDLIPQTSTEFDYNQSQIAGLWLEHDENLDPQSRLLVDKILAYYRNRHSC